MHDRMLNQLNNNAIKVSVHRLRYLPHQFPMVRGFIKKKEKLSTYALQMVSAKTRPRCTSDSPTLN
ncbi:hypothetical protein GA402_24845 [Bacteroides xylanisolvens]|nr:hypothetical protein GA402_24845 [Bacteroides xylanisolvens]KAB6117453.1 hypothetical protein GA432_27180 [Bacteroides xylanisolvens]KAB6150567.1 hypothetical protein GA423_27330 [Bacteroides xylanisolvens]